MHVKAKTMAFGGLLLALSVVFMALGSIIETSTLFLLAAASFFVGIVVREFGLRAGAAFYIAAVLLGFITAPNKFYVITFAAMGFYPVNPVSGEYTLSSPIFKGIEIELPDKKTFRISAPDASPENKYIKSVRLNGKELETPFISHEDIMNGGTLDFELTDKPCYNCFSGQVVEQQKQ